MIVLAIVALLVILCLTIGIFLYACGITRTVEVGAGPPPIGKVTLAYKFGRGPYNECGALFQEALKFAPPNTLTLGIYYDDPYKVSGVMHDFTRIAHCCFYLWDAIDHREHMILIVVTWPGNC